MKIFLILLSFFILSNCSKPKTVTICGDHECINKAEAEQYFKENLSIEIKVIDNRETKEINLVELNLNEENEGKRRVKIIPKKNINKELKVLSKDEVIKIKRNIKKKQQRKKIAKKKIKKKMDKNLKIKDTKSKRKKFTIKEKMDKDNNAIVDVCTILEKCSIEEISNYLLKKGNKNNFPDITTRQ